MVHNPFIENSQIEPFQIIPKQFLIERYKQFFNIDINYLLSSIDNIKIYRCQQSGYLFYYPFDIAGDSKFYERLQEHDWYYMTWKWEHQICKELIKEGDRILEVGCGKGDFLREISCHFNDVQGVGLELNKSAVTTEKNFKVLNYKIEDFSLENEGAFDLVCSFQVLEHISHVKSFLEAKIKCLKDDGLLVIGVPNNESYIKYDRFNILNMPPHHMGLWTEESLKMIGEHFNLELVKVFNEPLQDYHIDYYLEVMIKRYLGKFGGKAILKGLKLLYLKPLIKRYIKSRANNIVGHSILIVFKKIAGQI